MHRGGGVEEELLAISPPPEFQDSPAPPPVVFRDLSPCPVGAEGLTDCQQGKTVSQQPVWEFADRISFDILNEAMIIATEEVVLSTDRHGGSNRGSSVTAPSDASFFFPEFPIISDSSDSNDESNPLSTTTSWEYLSKTSSWYDHRYPVSALDYPPSQLHTSPRHQNHRLCRSRKSGNRNSNLEFTSSTSSNHTPVSFPNENTSLQHQEHQPTSIMRSASFHMKSPNLDFVERSRSRKKSLKKCTEKLVDKGKNNLDDESLCYNVPFQCDLYSLPLDSIVSQPENENQNRPIAAPRRSRVKGTLVKSLDKVTASSNDLRSKNQTVVNGECFSNSNTREEAGTSRNARQKVSVKPAISLDSSQNSRLYKHSNLIVGNGDERNNNIDHNHVCTTTATSDLRKGTRRSRSVEMSISANSARSHHDISSRNSIYSKESTTNLETRDLVTGKPEKRTLGHSILNLFKRNKSRTKADNPSTYHHSTELERSTENTSCAATNSTRALPPTPADTVEMISEADEMSVTSALQLAHVDIPLESRDFAASIEKVKDCGWYWGPLSSEAAEDLLRGEPDGSFIVRDSSDAHYIFSLTFKLNGLVRHVRIEHDQGNFSFGPLARFKAATIVDFVENAVAHSRSGRYLFFLHRRPVLGPMRVQLLHPYSRFRHPRSLQHMCRFVILKYVRRDLIHTLPLPKPLQDYLNTPHYYFEHQDEKRKEL